MKKNNTKNKHCLQVLQLAQNGSKWVAIMSQGLFYDGNDTFYESTGLYGKVRYTFLTQNSNHYHDLLIWGCFLSFSALTSLIWMIEPLLLSGSPQFERLKWGAGRWVRMSLDFAVWCFLSQHATIIYRLLHFHSRNFWCAFPEAAKQFNQIVFQTWLLSVEGQ